MAQAEPLAQELQDRITRLAESVFNSMQNEASEEQKNAYQALIAKVTTDAEFRTAWRTTMAAHWDESDANVDGKLDQTEFFAFLAKRKVCETGEHGVYWPDGMENSNEMWECVNAVSEGDGAVIADFLKVRTAMY